MKVNEITEGNFKDALYLSEGLVDAFNDLKNAAEDVKADLERLEEMFWREDKLDVSFMESTIERVNMIGASFQAFSDKFEEDDIFEGITDPLEQILKIQKEAIYKGTWRENRTLKGRFIKE